jgi:hypothetical protein
VFACARGFCAAGHRAGPRARAQWLASANMADFDDPDEIAAGVESSLLQASLHDDAGDKLGTPVISGQDLSLSWAKLGAGRAGAAARGSYG